MKHITRARRLRRYRRCAGRLGRTDESHENAAYGILVVQVCDLGTLPREVPEVGPLLTLPRGVVRPPTRCVERRQRNFCLGNRPLVMVCRVRRALEANLRP